MMSHYGNVERGISSSSGNRRNIASIQIERNENELDESSPILPVAASNSEVIQCFDKVFLTILMLILIIGCSTGLYLLIREDREWQIPEVYNLTSREFWQARMPSSTIPKLKLPVEKILLLQTNSSSCDSRTQCAQLVRRLQLSHMSQKEPDIFYNFLVSGDGSVFEGRGWNFQPTFPDSSSNTEVTLTVAFLGNFDRDPPTARQAESTKLFVDVAVMQGKLRSCFNVLVWGENRFFIDIAGSIQDTRSGC